MLDARWLEGHSDGLNGGSESLHQVSEKDESGSGLLEDQITEKKQRSSILTDKNAPYSTRQNVGQNSTS